MDLAFANRGRDLFGETWEHLAFLAYHGRQPLSELMRLTLTDLHHYTRALNEVLRRQQPKAPWEQDF